MGIKQRGKRDPAESIQPWSLTTTPATQLHTPTQAPPTPESIHAEQNDDRASQVPKGHYFGNLSLFPATIATSPPPPPSDSAGSGLSIQRALQDESGEDRSEQDQPVQEAAFQPSAGRHFFGNIQLFAPGAPSDSPGASHGHSEGADQSQLSIQRSARADVDWPAYYIQTKRRPDQDPSESAQLPEARARDEHQPNGGPDRSAGSDGRSETTEQLVTQQLRQIPDLPAHLVEQIGTSAKETLKAGAPEQPSERETHRRGQPQAEGAAPAHDGAPAALEAAQLAATQTNPAGQANTLPDTGQTGPAAETTPTSAEALKNVAAGKAEPAPASTAASAQAPDTSALLANLPSSNAPAAPAATPEAQAPAADSSASAATDSAQQAAPAQPSAAPTAAAPEQPAASQEPPAAGAAAEQAATLADAAASGEAAAQSASAPPPLKVPEPAAPVDAGGLPLASDPEGDAQMADIAAQIQSLRDQGHDLHSQADQQRGNAGILRSNAQLIKSHIASSEKATQTAQGHLTFRRNTLEQSRQALSASEQKATLVATKAAEGKNRASQERQRSQPMVEQSGKLASENSAHTPDDPKAAGKVQEQGQKLNKVNADSAKVDQAVGQAGTAADELVQDAQHATQVNTQTRSKIDSTAATLDQTDARINQLQDQNSAARDQIETLAEGPETIQNTSDELKAQGQASVAQSSALEARLQEVQKSYLEGMQRIPPPAPPEPDAAEEASAADEPAAAAPDETFADAAASPAAGPAPDALFGGTEPLDDDTGPVVQRQVADTAVEAPTTEQSEPIDLGKQLPSIVTGEEAPNAEERLALQQAEEQRRKDSLSMIQQEAGKHFENLSAGDKRMLALRMTAHNLFGNMGKISWPSLGGMAKGAGSLALSLIDPRASAAGILNGLSMIANGVVNFAKQPSWGGALKMAADVATGLAVVFGSITMLAGVIIGLMTALSFIPILLPFTVPIIAFFAMVTTVVGTLTFWTGLIAAGLQGLVFMKDLYMAGTAKTADELVNHADAMTTDARQGGNALMQAGIGKLSQIGGRSLMGEIQGAKGGMKFAEAIGKRNPIARAVRGVRKQGFGGYTRNVASGVKNGLVSLGKRGVAAAKSLPNRLASGLRSAPGRVLNGIRSAPGRLINGVRSIPGRFVKDMRQSFQDLRTGLSRDFLLEHDTGLANRGYRPKPGERTMTREQWRAARRNERLSERTKPDATERYGVRCLDDAQYLSKNPPSRPTHVSQEDWDRYLRYYNERLDENAAALLANPKAQVKPPRTWESYHEYVARFGRGTGFQDNVTKHLIKENPHLNIESNVGVKKVTNNNKALDSNVKTSKTKTEGSKTSNTAPDTKVDTTKYADQFAYDPVTKEVQAFSNKSRDFATIKDVEGTVEADVREALAKYSGKVEVRRPTHPLFGKEVEVKTITLVYDSSLAPAEMRDMIAATARIKARSISNSTTFNVVFLP